MLKERERKIDGHAAYRVAITTLGCKSNQYDSSAIEDSVTEAGFTLVDFAGPADAYIINTCTVTNRTDSQSRTLIRRVRKENARAVIIVTGCYATVSPGEIAEMDGVDYVVGNTGKDRLVKYITMGRRGAKNINPANETGAQTCNDAPLVAGVARGGGSGFTGSALEGPGTPLTLRTRSASKRTRATLKIQDGCSKACSYCIIPKARGTSRSIGFKDLATEIEAFIEAGYKEIVLTGIHLGDYAGALRAGTDGTARYADITAVARLMQEKEGEWRCRFRFSSLDPDEVTDEFIEILKTSGNICNHVHLPLQSGADEVLKRMNRQYSVARFTERVERLASIPGISIGTDIITGFPGESEEAFEATYSLLAGLPVNYLHIFPYSARKGTPAANYADTLHGTEIKRRAARLKELDRVKREEFFKAGIGTVAEVLIEKVETIGGVRRGTGKTGNYIPVTVTAPGIEANSLLKLRLVTVAEDAKGMVATPVTNPGRETAKGETVCRT